jgi:hypothetical protein
MAEPKMFNIADGVGAHAAKAFAVDDVLRLSAGDRPNLIGCCL